MKIEMDIQTEVQKIHHQFGVSEKANYEIQKLFDKAVKEAVTEALRIHDVAGESEQLFCDCELKGSSFQLVTGLICCCKCEKERAK